MTLSPEQVAERLGVHVRTVGAWISSGELPAVNVSKRRDSRKPRYRVRECDIERFLDGRSTAPQVPSTRTKRRKLPEVPDYV